MPFKGEVFKDIPGYEGLYQVGNYGTVRSIRFRNNQTSFHRIKVMNPVDHGNGYVYVTLSKNNKRKNFYVHRLVATAFLDPIPGKPFINHKDFNKRNNTVNNLEWCTQKENVNYSIKQMMHPRKNARLPKTGHKYIHKKKCSYEVDYEPLRIYKVCKTLEEALEFREKVIIPHIRERGWNGVII